MLLRDGSSWAGLASGPGAWVVSTQANYALAPWPLSQRWLVVLALAAVLVLVAVAGAFLSWRAWQGAQRNPGSSSAPSTQEFLAAIGALAGALFAVVIALQGYAGVVLG